MALMYFNKGYNTEMYGQQKGLWIAELIIDQHDLVIWS